MKRFNYDLKTKQLLIFFCKVFTVQSMFENAELYVTKELMIKSYKGDEDATEKIYKILEHYNFDKVEVCHAMLEFYFLSETKQLVNFAKYITKHPVKAPVKVK